MSLAEGILGVAQDAAGGENITSIRVRVGRLQHVTQDSLRFAFELVARDTNAETATIEVDQVPIKYRCKRCSNEGEIELPNFNCLSCSSSEVEILSGEEILVDSVELHNGQIIRRCDANLQDLLDTHIKEHHGNDNH